MISHGRFGRLFAAGLATCVLTACVSAHGTNAEGRFVLNLDVNPPQQVPPELQPYVQRFEDVLRYHGYKIAADPDPEALTLKLDYTAEPQRVEVSLLQNGRVVLSDYATPSMFSSGDDPALLDKLVSKAAKEFDGQIMAFSREVVVSEKLRHEPQSGAGPGADSDTTAEQIETGTAFATNSPTTYVTARHVVDGATHISLRCGQDKDVDATVQEIDDNNDLVVLRSEHKAPTFLVLAPADSASPGDHVFTMGFPEPDLLGVAPKYTDGAISALSGFGDTRSLMQITVPIQPGNSGGPLVDAQGRVVGVIDSTAAVQLFYNISGGALPQNVNFAVGAYYLHPLVKDIPVASDAAFAKLPPVKRVTASLCLVIARSPVR